MRIISQDGCVDFNYDNYSICLETLTGDWGYSARIKAVNGLTDFIIGSYDLKEQAIKQMKKIKLSYINNYKVYVLDEEETEEDCFHSEPLVVVGNDIEEEIEMQYELLKLKIMKEMIDEKNELEKEQK